MQNKLKVYLVGGVLSLVILAPRIALLMNGLDSQRIWDTNTPAAFRFLRAVEENKLGEFFAHSQKYPLFGSYLYVPVIGGYYGAQRWLGAYQSAGEFIDAYALGATNLFFWLRLEMLFLNLAGLLLLYHLTKKFTGGSSRAGLYVLILAAVNFYVTMFSVTPRIHSLAFVSTVLVLHASFLLLENKKTGHYLYAFGVSALAASVSQSGFTTLVLPVLAHVYNGAGGVWPPGRRKRWLCLGLALFVILTLVLGYPQLLVALFQASGSAVKDVLLSAEHSQPTFGWRYGTRALQYYFFSSEWLTTWLMLAGLWYVFMAKRKDSFALQSYDRLAIAHSLLFFLLFGFSDVFTGRFTLVVLPSVFFLLARVSLHCQRKKFIIYTAALLALVQLYAVGQLARIASAGDTRAEAGRYVLQQTLLNNEILSTIDSELLGLTPAPGSIRNGDSGSPGATDARIGNKDLIGQKSRRYTLWSTDKDRWWGNNARAFSYIIIAATHPDRAQIEELARANRFKLVQTFSARRRSDDGDGSFIAWDMISPPSGWRWPLVIGGFRAFGPTILVYEKI